MAADSGRGQPSLFIEILDWMMVPLILVWPVGIVLSYFLAHSIANRPYDRALHDTVTELAQDVRIVQGVLRVGRADPSRSMLRAGEGGAVYFQVRDASGRVLAGDAALPAPPAGADRVPGTVSYRDDELRGAPARIALLLVPDVAPGGPLLLQAATTTERRSELVSEIVTGLILPQFALFPFAAVLVWFGLSHGIRPLRALQAQIAARRPTDLSALDESAVPEEFAPVVRSMNVVMERLNENLQAQQRFVADAAHQLRTPLAGLRTQAQLALRAAPTPELRESLEAILAGTERASRLITQLLALARAETRHGPVSAFEPVDVNDLVRECVAQWVAKAREKGIDLGFDGSGWPAVVEGERLLLAEMFNNLLDNAIRYTPRGGRVTARVVASKRVLVQVEDTGIGIPEAERELVFQRFYRVLGSGVDGSGLGLAIVRGIAERHRGTVSVGAGPGGRGAVFAASLPRRQLLPAD